MAMPDDELLELLQGILTDIYEKVGATDWTKERQQRIVKAQIVELLRRFDVAIDELVPQMITEEYFKGVESAGAALVKEGVLSSSAAAIDASGRITKEFRKPIYLDSLQTILEDTFLDLKAAIRTAEMSSITTIDSTIKKVKDEIAKGTISGNSRKVMQANVAKAFREDGMTAFITKDGKSLPLDFYAMTVTRTKTRTAGVEAASKRYEDNGQDLVQVEGNGDSCVICSRYRGMIFSLRGETEGYPVAGEGDYRLPIFHPNCRCTISPYVLSRKQQKEINEGKKRNAEFDPNEDRRTPAQRKAYEREQELRRKAREELKQFQRFNEALGADNYKTLGAFRKAKRENSPKFQELQSAYRSASMRNRVIKPKTPLTGSGMAASGLRDTDIIKTRIPPPLPRKKSRDFNSLEEREAYRELSRQRNAEIEEATQQTVKEIRERPQFLKTKPEAEEWIKKNYMAEGRDVDLRIENVDIEIVSLYCELFDKVSADFPQLKNKFTRFSTIDDGSGGLMEATRGIGFGQGKLEDLVRYVSHNTSTGYTVGNNVHDTMIHEMGHNLDQVFETKGAGEYKAYDVWREEFMRNKRQDFAMARKLANDFDDEGLQEYSDRLSKYGFTNDEEYFAEGFSAMYAGAFTKKDVEEFATWINKVSELDRKGANRKLTDKEYLDAFENKKVEGLEYP